MKSKKWVEKVADQLILPGVISYSSLGYQARKLFLKPIEENLEAETILVTGATSGLGLAVCRELFRLNATLIITYRNENKLTSFFKNLGIEANHTRVKCFRADLSRKADVRDLINKLSAMHISRIVHNAGVLATKFQQSDFGCEASLATNLIAPYLITRGLEEKLKKKARIIFVSSGGMYPTLLKVKELDCGPDGFDGVKAYSRAKRAMVVLGEILAQQFAAKGVDVFSMHPGWADTAGVKNSIPGFYKWTKKILRSPAEGADTIVWLCADQSKVKKSGTFWFDREQRDTYLLPFTKESETERERLMTYLDDFAL